MSEVPDTLSASQTPPLPPQNNTTSSKKKTPLYMTIITILLLWILFPIGVLVMWLLTYWPKWIKITFTLILLSPLLFIAVFIFLLRPFQITGDAMFPSYYDSEHVMTTVRFSTIKRGDVIVFKPPIDPNKDYIKRVIGIQGDKISLDNGTVYINDEKLDESGYVGPDVKTYGGNFLPDKTPIFISQDMYFVLGDNRQNSSDSRAWGLVPKKDIISKVLFCYSGCKPLNK